jgi:hypothetical protein
MSGNFLYVWDNVALHSGWVNAGMQRRRSLARECGYNNVLEVILVGTNYDPLMK